MRVGELEKMERTFHTFSGSWDPNSYDIDTRQPWVRLTNKWMTCINRVDVDGTCVSSDSFFNCKEFSDVVSYVVL